jgi:hypothetical protein
VSGMTLLILAFRLRGHGRGRRHSGGVSVAPHVGGEVGSSL